MNLNTPYLNALRVTAMFCTAVTVLALGTALLLAVMADSALRGAVAYRTLLVWPYAVAPAVAAALWVFLFNPTVGVLAVALRRQGVDWNFLLNGNQALLLVILAAAWKQVSYNFLFFLAGLQAIPRSLIEAAAIDGAGPWRRFWTIKLPLLSPTTFFLLIINLVYAFFDTFGVIDAITAGGPFQATTTLVYKVYKDGVLQLDLGGSAAGADRGPDAALVRQRPDRDREIAMGEIAIEAVGKSFGSPRVRGSPSPMAR